MSTSKYTKVIGENTPIGFLYRISNDDLTAFNKDDCAYRIRMLCTAGRITAERKTDLLQQLKAIKRK